MRILTKNEFSLIYLSYFILSYFILSYFIFNEQINFVKKKKKEINKLISYYDKCHIKYE